MQKKHSFSRTYVLNICNSTLAIFFAAYYRHCDYNYRADTTERTDNPKPHFLGTSWYRTRFRAAFHIAPWTRFNATRISGRKQKYENLIITPDRSFER